MFGLYILLIHASFDSRSLTLMPDPLPMLQVLVLTDFSTLEITDPIHNNILQLITTLQSQISPGRSNLNGPLVLANYFSGSC